MPWRARRALLRTGTGLEAVARAVDGGLTGLAAGTVALVRVVLGLPPAAASSVAGAWILAAGGAVAAWLLLGRVSADGIRELTADRPYVWALAPLAAVLLAHATWTALHRDRPRRPVLLVVDDLDRCEAQRVVRLLETVHTLLRERPDVRFLPRWRRAAPLVVLVLADGRWVRRSFETVYADHEPLGSPVHGLGADFLQKVFDHVVLVPAMSADQVEGYVDDVTQLSPWAVTGRRASPDAAAVVTTPPPAPGVAEVVPFPAAASAAAPDDDAPGEASGATVQAEAVTASSGAAQAHGEAVRRAIDVAPVAERQRLAEEVATRAASPESVAAFSRHLLAAYTPLMPANPRLVKRVANTFGMLLALALHTGHREPEDHVARAAIVFVRFPTLVDDLLSAPDPPVIDPAATADRDSPWLRRDVQQVLRGDDGSVLDVLALARCFGREFAPGVPSAGRPASTGL